MGREKVILNRFISQFLFCLRALKSESIVFICDQVDIIYFTRACIALFYYWKVFAVPAVPDCQDSNLLFVFECLLHIICQA